MSWSPELYIGEFRPWPDTVHVVRGKTEETRRYVSEDFSAISRENVELRELVASVWRLFTEHGAVHPSDLPEVDAVRDRMRELGIEVDSSNERNQ